MTTMRLRSLALAAFVAALAACAAPEPKTPPPPAVDVVALVASIRAAAGPDDAKDELAIKPLRDPMVEDQRAQAQRLEREGHYKEAAAALDQALALVGDDPALLQERAEAALLLQDFAGAESFALKAHGLGAQVGPLCRRHWATIRATRGHRNDAAGVAEADRQFQACKVTAPPRY